MGKRKVALYHAFHTSLPIMAGYGFLGLTYGIYMHELGFNFLYPMLLAITVYAGSAEFLLGNMLLAASSLGLGSCWINRAKEEFESDEGKALLKKWGIEGDWVGIGHCILGYPAADPKPAAPRKPDYIVKV